MVRIFFSSSNTSIRIFRDIDVVRTKLVAIYYIYIDIIYRHVVYFHRDFVCGILMYIYFSKRRTEYYYKIDFEADFRFSRFPMLSIYTRWYPWQVYDNIIIYYSYIIKLLYALAPISMRAMPEQWEKKSRLRRGLSSSSRWWSCPVWKSGGWEGG